MKKLQQFYVYKFHSQRLKNYKYNVTITPNEARENEELISIGDSQVIRTIRKIRYEKIPNTIQYSKEELEELYCEENRIKSMENSLENRKRLQEINKIIDDMLFVPEYVFVVMDNNRHYDYIIKNGFFINNVKFERLLCSAGNARLDTVAFCSVNISEQLKNILRNDAKPIEITGNKYNAYFSLVSSATHEVSAPNVLVVDDCVIKRKKIVDWITEHNGKDDEVNEMEKELEFNLFDGMGLISPKMSEKWGNELELDYIPSAFCVRNVYIKGMLCTMDIHMFAENVAEEYIVKDLWGNDIDVRNVDVILTKSQFKLWNAYSSWNEYEDCCKKNDLSWGVARATPNEDNTSVFTNYQFLQALNLNDKQIESLCKSTIDWISNVLGGKIEYTLLYLMGKACEPTKNCQAYDKISDVVTKALILNESLINDTYIKNTLLYSINKKIKQSYIGKLLVEGNFSVMISDPYALLEHVFSSSKKVNGVNGLLREREYYSNFWNKRKVKKVSAMRSPLTWRSEVNVLCLKPDVDWYRYLKSGIVYNIWGCDCMIHADSDFDYDIVCTTSAKEIIDGSYGGLPVSYEKKTVKKSFINEDELYLSDKQSFHSKIGFVTNISTSYYALYDHYKDLFSEECAECKEIIKRLKICRKEQGSQIDKAKGILVKEFPKHWSHIQKIENGMTDNKKERIEFENRLAVNKRPYFFRYLYRNYNSKYNEYIKRFNNISIRSFGCELKELLTKRHHSGYEKDFLENFKNMSPLIESSSVMNKICRYMEKHIGLIKINHRASNIAETTNILKNGYVPEKNELKKMEILYAQFNEYKDKIRKSKNKEFRDFQSMAQLHGFLKNDSYKINSNECNLATIGVILCYEIHKSGSKDFVWKIFGDGLLKNIESNTIRKSQIPYPDEFGDIEYLGKKYTMMEVRRNT